MPKIKNPLTLGTPKSYQGHIFGQTIDSLFSPSSLQAKLIDLQKAKQLGWPKTLLESLTHSGYMKIIKTEKRGC